MLYSHPEKPLQHHLEEVELAAMAILGRHPCQPFASLGIDVVQAMRQLSGWHDIAKATAFFQQYICDTEGWQKKVARNAASNEQKTHTPLGALLAADYFQTQQPWYLSLLMTMAIRGHHSRLPVHLWHPVGTLLTELAAAGRSRLLLMTATQPGIIPPSSRLDLIDQPRRFAQPRYQMEIDLSEQPLSQWLDSIADEIISKPEVKKWLLVFNTRRCAQDVYKNVFHCDLP